MIPEEKIIISKEKKKLTLVKFITRSLYLECLKQFVKIK